MVFKEISRIWKKGGLVTLALEETNKMFKEDKVMFETAVNGLLENKPVNMNIYRMDERVNRYEINIRKKILEHLAINPTKDVTASLLLIGVVHETERIGDYAKNIADLNKMYPGKLGEGEYGRELKKAAEMVLSSFDLTIKAFEESDRESAREVMNLHHKDLNKELKAMLRKIMNDKNLRVKKAVACALLARYLRRISAHLTNIASTVVNPFHKIRQIV